jgi:hypothetical protein
MGTIFERIKLEQLHKIDEIEWIYENMRLIREGKIEDVDWKNIYEKLDFMASSEKRDVFCRMSVLILHLLKWIFQKEKRSNSWVVTIKVQRDELGDSFEGSKILLEHGLENFNKVYKISREFASDNMDLPLKNFPEEPPFTFDQALDKNYLPD